MKTALIYGPPGSGKSTIARFISKKLGNTIVLEPDDIAVECLKLGATPEDGFDTAYRAFVNVRDTNGSNDVNAILCSAMQKRERWSFFDDLWSDGDKSLCLRVESDAAHCAQRCLTRQGRQAVGNPLEKIERDIAYLDSLERNDPRFANYYSSVEDLLNAVARELLPSFRSWQVG